MYLLSFCSGPSPSLYSHSSHLPPSPLHSLHSTAFTHTHTHPLHPHHHPHAHPHPVPHSSHGMFAPPIPPGPSALASSGLSSVSASSFGSDLLRGEFCSSVWLFQCHRESDQVNGRCRKSSVVLFNRPLEKLEKIQLKYL